MITRHSYFKYLIAIWTQRSYMHYCMVSSLILCHCMSVINDGIGMYTGILAVTLWNICEPGLSPLWHPSWSWMSVINKCWQIRQGLVVVIILLHSLTTISSAANWSYVHSAFIENGKSFWTVYLWFNGSTQSAFLVLGIASAMSTITHRLIYGVCNLMGIIHMSSSLFWL